MVQPALKLEEGEEFVLGTKPGAASSAGIGCEELLSAPLTHPLSAVLRIGRRS